MNTTATEPGNGNEIHPNQTVAEIVIRHSSSPEA